MPDVLTHILFAENVREFIKDNNIRDFIEENVNLYNLAAQGPDILFYYKPWNPFGRGIRETGEKMHHRDSAKFFIESVKLLQTMTGEEYEKMLVYVIGFMSHYYCDKTAHPYVYGMMEDGCYTYDGGRRKLSHYEIEAAIDTRLWSEEKRMAASDTNNSELIKVETLPMVVSDYLSKYIYESQGTVISISEINKAVANMIAILGILYDPDDRKKKIINKLPLPRKCYIEGEFPDVDVLNIKRRPWKIPKDGTEVNLSVGQLLSEGAQDCSEVVNSIIDLLETGSKTDLEAIIPDEDYCTRETLKSG